MERRVMWVGLIGGFFFAAGVCASDYPQFRGVNRDGRAAAEETGLLGEWPPEGPPPLWKTAGLGRGYSQPTYAQGVIYITGELGDDLALSALDAQTGTLRWRQILPGQAWPEGGRNWPGARSAPTCDVAAGRLYFLTAHGVLSAHRMADGKPLWSRKASEWGGKTPQWGFAESPLATGDLVIVTPGGSNTMAAVDASTGADVWKSVGANMPAHYCSAILVETGGKTLAVNGTGGGILGVDLKTGKVAFTNDFCVGNTANCPSPLYDDGAVFWANGYRKGGIALALSEQNGDIVAKEIYRVPEASVHHGGYVKAGPCVYGSNERELLCLEGGKVKWSDRRVGKGSIHYADGRLYCFSDKGGTAVLVEPDAAGYREKGRFTVPGSGMSWAYPVVADKRLLLRYGAEGDTLYAYDVAARP